MTGRPSSYTDEIAQEICERIGKGESLRSVCRDDHIPHRTTILRWLRERKDFRTQYAHAREDQADFWADEIIEIADAPMSEAHEVNQARLRVDSRKWIAGKLKPKKYGDKIQQEHTVDDATAKLLRGRQRARERNRPES